ncbi:hypothetical protein DL766_003707 [Monosporascus sp. MC13-8B]|nr:hypothetical protein DL763_008342 [Monosporascus cannonballus]RYP32983.1 hypothetical protein DL766_003707 [Monosporascus sp. MC13-8B]
MPPQKRKRPHNDLTDSAAQPAQPQLPAPTRRATRRNPQGLLDDEKHQLRSGRVRASAVDDSIVVEPAPERARGKKQDAPKTNPDPSAVVPAKQTRKTRHAAAPTEPPKENITASSKPQTASAVTSPPKPLTSHDAPPSHPAMQTRSPSSHSRTQPRAALPKPCPQQRPLNRIPSSSAASALATPKRAAFAEKPLKQQQQQQQQQPPPTPRSDRNIDKVVLGDICFKAWYPSYYGKEVLGDVSGNAGGSKDIGARMVGGGGKRDPPVLDRLYVCPCCFKYSKELMAWWEHVRCCERKGVVPGRKVYTHPKGRGLGKATATPADSAAGTKGKGKKRSDVAAPTVEENTEEEKEEGEWSVWEVDGESERLFCQNLSLFAKLFLDNKSVFFDVSGFNYFLLVYTPHNTLSPPAPPETAAQQTSSSSSSTPNRGQDPRPRSPPTPPSITNPSSSPLSRRPRPHTVGFFSKEKMSWDNNNLACILVFPPWQRKGLGSVLMGVSYEISRREGVLGGPEKPISELGRRGYRRFWAGEIARWLLGLEVGPNPSSATTIPSSTASPSSGGAGDGGEGGQERGGGDEKGRRRAEDRARETQPLAVVDVQTCSRATWIAPEDCLLVLREMGVVEEASPKPPGPGNTAAAPASATAAGPAPAEAEDAAAKGKDGGPAVVASASPPRVRIDKAAVRRWVEANGIGLERTCDPDGFLEGYAVKEAQPPDDEVGE